VAGTESVPQAACPALQSFDNLFGDRTSRVIIVHPDRLLPLARGSEDQTISVRQVDIPSGRFPFLLPLTRKPAHAPSSRNIAHGLYWADEFRSAQPMRRVGIAMKNRGTSSQPSDSLRAFSLRSY